MKFVVALGDDAIADLNRLHGWIEGHADALTADTYDRRLRAFIRALADFPNRGTPQGTVASGLRTITFERRQIILYRVIGRTVDVVRVLDGRRDWHHLLRD